MEFSTDRARRRPTRHDLRFVIDVFHGRLSQEVAREWRHDVAPVLAVPLATKTRLRSPPVVRRIAPAATGPRTFLHDLERELAGRWSMVGRYRRRIFRQSGKIVPQWRLV